MYETCQKNKPYGADDNSELEKMSSYGNEVIEHCWQKKIFNYH